MRYPENVTRIIEPINLTAAYATFGLGSAIKSSFLTSVTKLSLGGIGSINLISALAPGKGTPERVVTLIKTATVYYAGFVDGLLDIVKDSKTIIAPAMQILTGVFAYRTKLAFKGDDVVEKVCAGVLTVANQTGVIGLLVENDTVFDVSCFTAAGAGLCLTLHRINQECKKTAEGSINTTYSEIVDEESSTRTCCGN